MNDLPELKVLSGHISEACVRAVEFAVRFQKPIFFIFNETRIEADPKSYPPDLEMIHFLKRGIVK